MKHKGQFWSISNQKLLSLQSMQEQQAVNRVRDQCVRISVRVRTAREKDRSEVSHFTTAVLPSALLPIPTVTP